MLDRIINVGDIIDPEKNGQKLAIIDLYQGYPRFFSYDQLDQQSTHLARGLKKKNINPGDKIAIMSENSFEFLVCFFGILKLGAVAVLINNKITKNQISIILEETKPKILFTDSTVENNIECIDISKNFKNLLDPGDLEIYCPYEDDLAFILYTSGSYNNPKGALISHKNHAWAIHRHATYDKDTSEKRIILISAPLFHANGLTTTEGSIAGHSTIVLLPKFDPKESIKVIEKFKINTIYGVPTMLSMMLQEQNLLKTHNLKSIKNIRMASSHVSEKLMEKLKNYFPEAVISNNYGITEVGPGLFGPHPLGIKRPEKSVGYPSPGIEYRIVNGILEIKSPSMMQSYLNDHAAITEDGFFITNDLFEVDKDGFYYYLGRADDMFKCGGYKVYPAEVESILDSHPSIFSSIVVGYPDDIKGYKPYAFVIAEKNASVTEEELKEYCLKQGPAYQHPRKIWFLNEFPLAGTNKVDKKKLLEIIKTNLTTDE